MIVLDTNVISELLRPASSPAVRDWLDAQLIETLHLFAITVAELRVGMAIMPAGKRRSVLQARLESEVIPAFRNRILPFDVETTRVYADLMARARQHGKAIGKEDGYIAASALQHGCMVATRDESPFRSAGVEVINPWLA